MWDDIKKYQQMYMDWTKIDDINLEEKCKQVPSQKQFWSSRLLEAQIKKLELEKKKKLIKDELIQSRIKDSPVALNKKTLDEVEDSDYLEKINNKIEENDVLIMALTGIVKNVTFIAQDMKNIIDSKKLNEI